MSWNAPQTITEAIESVRMGWSFQSHLGVKGQPVWVLTDIVREFHATVNADWFAQELILRNWYQTERYMKEGRTYKDDDLVYVVGRHGELLVGMLRDGTILQNESEVLTRSQKNFRDRAVVALKEHTANGGHLNRYEG